MRRNKRIPQCSTAGFYEIKDSPRHVFNFNPGWRFYKGEVKGAQDEYFNDNTWEAASLPHGLEILGENASGMRNYQGPAWYRKHFTLPEALLNKRIVVHFEAVMGEANVWVNGQMAVQHCGGYLPFAADITHLVYHDGRRNVIAVRADNSDNLTYPPGKPQDYLDFSYFGGIYRDVYMIGTESLHVSHPLLSQTIAGGGVFVGIHDIEGNDAEIEIRTEIINEDDRVRNIILRTTLETMEGTELIALQEEVGIPMGETTAFIQQINAADIRLWHPDDPYLHFIRTELWEGNMLIDSLRTRFGIRLFEMRDHEGFFINKQRIVEKLSGVNRHQDYAYVGNALPDSGQWRDAVLIREGGSNIVRAAHYPLASSFMDACDELGLLVTVATPGWQYYNHEDPIFEQRVLGDTRAMVRRDRNRPAVLLWETALNETDDQPISMLRKLHHIVHEEIPFPGVYTAADVISAKKADLDLYYHGNVPYNKCSIRREYGDGGEVDNFVSQNAMTRVKREWGEQAMLTQALIRAKDLNEMFSTPTKQIGATVWCGIDHQRGYHPDPFLGGLLDVFRLPRYSYYLFKSQHHPDFTLDGIETGPMVYITHELTQVSGHDVILFSNCEEVRLTWLGVEIGTQKPEAGYEAMPHPPVIFKDVFDFHEISTNWRGRTGEIEMVAEGLIAGKVVCRKVRKYPERLSGIRLEIDDVNIDLSADGSDFVPVRAVLIDNKGVPKVLSNEFVHFTVEGPGEIIESSVYGVNPMRTQFGVATVLIRATTEVGEIQVTATSDGVGMDQIVLQSQAPLLPLLYDKSYVCTSSNSNAGTTESQQTSATNIMRAPSELEMSKLEATIKRLKLELISKEQDIMELRGNTPNHLYEMSRTKEVF